MNKMLALMKKDFKLLFRDKMAVFFTFVFPLVFAFIFGSIFSLFGEGPARGRGSTPKTRLCEPL